MSQITNRALPTRRTGYRGLHMRYLFSPTHRHTSTCTNTRYSGFATRATRCWFWLAITLAPSTCSSGTTCPTRCTAAAGRRRVAPEPSPGTLRPGDPSRTPVRSRPRLRDGRVRGHTGAVVGTPTVLLIDSEPASFDHTISTPFARTIITPNTFRKDLGDRHYVFPGSRSVPTSTRRFTNRIRRSGIDSASHETNRTSSSGSTRSAPNTTSESAESPGAPVDESSNDSTSTRPSSSPTRVRTPTSRRSPLGRSTFTQH